MKQGIEPELIRQGNKLYQVKIPKDEDASVIIIMMWDPLTSDIATLVGGPDQ